MAGDAHERGRSRAYAEGYRLGLADARVGAIRFICGDLRDGPTAQRVAGYQAGLAAGKQARERDFAARAGEREAEAG
jgi:hypothetical protein